jgi:transcriptional regulator with XRE-family HTH domain
MSLGPSDARLIREHIAKIRKLKGYTQAELSEAIGKGQKYIGRVETGEIDTPPLDVLAQIADNLGCPFSYIFFTDGFGDTTDELRTKIQKLVETTDDLATLQRCYRSLLISKE